MKEQQPERRNPIRAAMGAHVEAILQQTRDSAELLRQGRERRREQRRQLIARRRSLRPTPDRRQTIIDRRQPVVGA